jgi:hypothetical protein
MRVLPQPGRPVEEHSLGGGQPVLVEERLVDIRELDRITDRLDLLTKAPDVLVRDIRHFFEDEFLDLGSDQPLVEEPGPGVEPNMVPHPDECVLHGAGDLDDPFLVGSRQHDHPAVAQYLLDPHHLARLLERADVDHVHRLVQQHFLAGLEFLDLDARFDVDPEFAAPGHDVEGAVGVDPLDDPEGVGRRGQLLDLVAKDGQLFAGFLEGHRELLVLRNRLVDAAFRLEQPFLEHADAARGILEAPAKDGDLLLQHLYRAAEFVDGRLAHVTSSLWPELPASDDHGPGMPGPPRSIRRTFRWAA